MPAGPRVTEIIASGRPAKRVWGFALCAAILFHAVALAAVWSRLKVDEDDEQLGAPAIEIGLEWTAPRKEETDLPPGPDSEASTASAAAVDQKAKVEETDLPKDRPVETEDPDRVAAPDAAKTPKDDKPNTLDAKANPAAEAVASEATAAPSSEVAHEAPRSAAPSPGTGESAQRIKATWQKELIAHLNRYKRYPAATYAHSAPVMLSFTLDRLGHVVSMNLQHSSGDPAFDQAALAMMTRADPVPPPPPAVADEGLTFTMPVIFRDRKK